MDQFHKITRVLRETRWIRCFGGGVSLLLTRICRFLLDLQWAKMLEWLWDHNTFFNVPQYRNISPNLPRGINWSKRTHSRVGLSVAYECFDTPRNFMFYVCVVAFMAGEKHCSATSNAMHVLISLGGLPNGQEKPYFEPGKLSKLRPPAGGGKLQ
jgi:hypothetical protein